METWDAIRARRNVRQYTDQPIAHEDLERICDAGRRSPVDARQRDWRMLDIGQATAIMMLAAADLGIGSGHSAVTDQQQAQRVLGFPGGYFAVFMIGLGYPADRPLRPLARPNRRPFDEVVHWNRW